LTRHWAVSKKGNEMFANQWQQDAALGYEPSALAQGTADGTGGSADSRAQWALVLKGATLYTAMAVVSRDLTKVRQGEQIISLSSGHAGLNSALFSAIFGGEIPEVDLTNPVVAACFEAGKTASKQDVDQASEVVRADKARRDASAQARRDAERSAAKAAYAAKKAADAAAWAAEAPQRKAAADKAAAEKSAAQAAAKEKAEKEAAAAAAETEAAVAKIVDTAAVGHSGAMYLTQEKLWAVRSPRIRTEGSFAHGQKYARIEIVEVYGNKVLRVLPEGDASRDLLCAAAIAAGAIEIDGVILCDDGSEIFLEK
jgi:hypothetical protein